MAARTAQGKKQRTTIRERHWSQLATMPMDLRMVLRNRGWTRGTVFESPGGWRCVELWQRRGDMVLLDVFREREGAPELHTLFSPNYSPARVGLVLSRGVD